MSAEIGPVTFSLSFLALFIVDFIIFCLSFLFVEKLCGFKLNKDATYNMRRNMGIPLRFLYFRRNLLVFDKII